MKPNNITIAGRQFGLRLMIQVEGLVAIRARRPS